jgi:hypothetical protein
MPAAACYQCQPSRQPKPASCQLWRLGSAAGDIQSAVLVSMMANVPWLLDQCPALLQARSMLLVHSSSRARLGDQSASVEYARQARAACERAACCRARAARRSDRGRGGSLVGQVLEEHRCTGRQGPVRLW